MLIYARKFALTRDLAMETRSPSFPLTVLVSGTPKKSIGLIVSLPEIIWNIITRSAFRRLLESEGSPSSFDRSTPQGT